MNYTTQIVKRDGGLVRYITGIERGKHAWYFLELTPEEYSAYKKKIKTGAITLAKFGKMLACGWGENAPADILSDMQRRYNIKI